MLNFKLSNLMYSVQQDYHNTSFIGGYGKWVNSKSKCATTLGVFRGPFQAIWNQNWVICLKKTP